MNAPETNMQACALQTSGLTLSRGARKLLAGLNWQGRGGELWCLLGPNGVGKTTLLHALAGVLPAAGIRLNDRSLNTWEHQELALVRGFMPQHVHDAFSASVLDTVLLGRHPHLGRWDWENAEDVQLAQGALQSVGMEAFADRDVLTLSGGERQRIVIARALAQEAPVLLLDEPTAALDIGYQQQALELVDDLRREKGLTVVSAMHDLTLAGLYADRLVLMHQGSCVASGDAQTVLRSETLAEFYGVSARVHHEADGTVVVIPQRATNN